MTTPNTPNDPQQTTPPSGTQSTGGGVKSLFSKTLEKLPLSGLKGQLRESLIPIIEDLFKQLKLVTREEFDIQSQVLAKTREKVEALEKLVAALEEKAKGK